MRYIVACKAIVGEKHLLNKNIGDIQYSLYIPSKQMTDTFLLFIRATLKGV